MLRFNTYISERPDLADLVKCPTYMIPSFQLRRDHSGAALTELYFVDPDSNETNVSDYFYDKPETNEYTSYDFIHYNCNPLIKDNCGDTNLLAGMSGWNNGLFGDGYGTLTSTNQEFTSAIGDASPLHYCYSDDIGAVSVGDIFVFNLASLNVAAGQNPYVVISSSTGGVVAISNAVQLQDDATRCGLTITTTSAHAYVEVYNTGATQFTSDNCTLYTQEYLYLDKDFYYMRIKDGTNIWYSEWFSMEDIHPNRISSLENSAGANPFEVFTTSDTAVTAAVNISGANGYAFSDAFDIVKGQDVTVVFYMDLNSGSYPKFYLVDGDVALVSNQVDAVAGRNKITLTPTVSCSAKLSIGIEGTHATDFATSDIWVTDNECDLIALNFENSLDFPIGVYDFQDGFEHEGWIKATLKHGEHQTQITATQFDGINTNEEVINQQTYVLRCILTEAQYWLLQTLPAHDTVTIIDKNGKEYTAENIEVNQPVWFRGYCNVQVRFTTSDAISLYRINEDQIT